jgi:hypothetical protein
MGSNRKTVHCFVLGLLALMLLCYSPLSAQFLTGTIGLRTGINHNAFVDLNGNEWQDMGRHIGIEVGVSVIPCFELVTNVSYLATKYSYIPDTTVYYNKDMKEYSNLYVPCRLRINLWTIGFLQPNIELGWTFIRQYSGYRQIEYHIPFRYPIPSDELKAEFGLLCGLGTKVNVVRYLSIIPSIHYQRNLGEENAYHLLFSLGISYGG